MNELHYDLTQSWQAMAAVANTLKHFHDNTCITSTDQYEPEKYQQLRSDITLLEQEINVILQRILSIMERLND